MADDGAHDDWRTFAKEYAGWTLAPIPFAIPWAIIAAMLSKRIAGLNFKDAWSKRFMPRLLENVGVWLSSYLTAWALFRWVRTNRTDLKYIAHSPKPDFILTEVARSFGGIVVLTLYQGLCRARNARAFTNFSAGAKFAMLLGVSFWADFHFYAVHRLMHVIPALYRRVHKVHHRSNNVTPWSGLSMHPVEHALYFSALLPFLLFPQVPYFILRAQSNGLIVYPVPAHIGLWPFERHHFQHHVEFNYNYGSSELFDVLFGTTYAAFAKKRGKGGKALSERDKARAAEASRQRELANSGA